MPAQSQRQPRPDRTRQPRPDRTQPRPNRTQSRPRPNRTQSPQSVGQERPPVSPPLINVQEPDKWFENLHKKSLVQQARQQARYSRLLVRQEQIQEGIGKIYEQGIQRQEDRDALSLILNAIEQDRIGKAELGDTIELLHKWAQSINASILENDEKLAVAIACLDKFSSLEASHKHYFEVNLPLIPGILNYKSEISVDHKFDLGKIWNNVLGWVGCNVAMIPSCMGK